MTHVEFASDVIHYHNIERWKGVSLQHQIGKQRIFDPKPRSTRSPTSI